VDIVTRTGPTQTSKRLVAGDPTYQDADLEEVSSALAREARPQRRGQEGAATKAQGAANGAAQQARPEKARPEKARPRGAAREAHGRKRKAGSVWHGAAKRRGQDQPLV
jgi:hypothetical protein